MTHLLITQAGLSIESQINYNINKSSRALAQLHISWEIEETAVIKCISL